MAPALFVSFVKTLESRANSVLRCMQRPRRVGQRNCKDIQRKSKLDLPPQPLCISTFLTRLKYPAAYRAYWSHCLKFSDKPSLHAIPDLTSKSGGTVSVPYPDGTALLISPQLVDYERGPNRKKHWIICLFTSSGYGARVDSPTVIINKTAAALSDLKQQLHEMESLSNDTQDKKIKHLFACRFNSGLFKVPWGRTRSVIEEVGIGMTIVIPNEEMPKPRMKK